MKIMTLYTSTVNSHPLIWCNILLRSILVKTRWDRIRNSEKLEEYDIDSF